MKKAFLILLVIGSVVVSTLTWLLVSFKRFYPTPFVIGIAVLGLTVSAGFFVGRSQGGRMKGAFLILLVIGSVIVSTFFLISSVEKVGGNEDFNPTPFVIGIAVLGLTVSAGFFAGRRWRGEKI